MIAHELAHVRRRDVLAQTSAVLLAVVLVDISRIGGWFERALLAVLGPIAAAFVHLLLSPRARAGCGPDGIGDLLGSGDGLADASCSSTRKRSRLVPGEPCDEPLYTVNPFEETGLAALFVTHPPLARRLHELAG